MIEFIKSNSNILIFIFLLLLTIDGFLLIIKYRNYLESRPNLKISYDKFKSYCLTVGANTEYKFLIINLTIKNLSTKSIDITNMKLIYGSKPYLAVSSEMVDDFYENIVTSINDKDADIIEKNTLLENVLKGTNIPPSGTLTGFVLFDKIKSYLNIKSCKIVVETPGKEFEKEITLDSLTDEFSDD